MSRRPARRARHIRRPAARASARHSPAGTVATTGAALLLVLAVVLALRAWPAVGRAGEGADPAAPSEVRAALDATPSGEVPQPDPPRPSPLPARQPHPSGGGEVPASAGGPGPAPPRTLIIPAAEVEMPVRPTGVDRAGLMALPRDVDRAGWYRYGPAPGSERGAAVIAGHVDAREQGVGPLARLSGLEKGDRLVVVLADHTRVRYRVTAILRVRKEDLDLDAVFDRDGPHRLRVLTCGGAFDPARHRYEDNVLVTATPTGRT